MRAVGLDSWKINGRLSETLRIDFSNRDGSHSREFHFVQVSLAHVKSATVTDDSDFNLSGGRVGRHERFSMESSVKCKRKADKW